MIPRQQTPRVGDVFVKSDFKDTYQIVGSAASRVWTRNLRSGQKKGSDKAILLGKFATSMWRIVIFQDDNEIVWQHPKDMADAGKRRPAVMAPIFVDETIDKEMIR